MRTDFITSCGLLRQQKESHVESQRLQESCIIELIMRRVEGICCSHFFVNPRPIGTCEIFAKTL